MKGRIYDMNTGYMLLHDDGRVKYGLGELRLFGYKLWIK